jgi:cytochrome oxidase assembly protein ShyY1
MTHKSQEKPRFEWQPNSKILLFALFFLPLLVSLGFWQLQRAEEKQQILDRYQTNRQLPPLTLARELDSDRDQQYRRAQLEVEIDNSRVIILDNRVKYGRPGYEILQVARLSGEPSGLSKKLLVNRGWVPASLDRNQLPDYPTMDGSLPLRGFLYRTLRGGYQLDDGITTLETGATRVGWISVERAERLWGEDFFPYQLRLDRDSLAALDTGWPTVSVQPQKHTAYAVQWFAMALTLLLLTFTANSNLMSLLTSSRSESRSD